MGTHLREENISISVAFRRIRLKGEGESVQVTLGLEPTSSATTSAVGAPAVRGSGEVP